MSYFELYHHGRLGQKWGDRNGPPYPLTSHQLSRAERKAANQSTTKSRKVRQNKGSESKKETSINYADDIKNATTETTKAVRSAGNIYSRYRKQKVEFADYSDLTDKEMQDYIRRANLEKQYARIKAEEAEKGKAKVDNILDTVGDVAAIGASVAAIAAAFSSIEKKAKGA